MEYMALVKCKECGNEISSKADKCPHCGVKLKGDGISCSSCGCLILIVFFMMSCAAIQEGAQSSRLSSANDEKIIPKATKTIKTYKKGETVHVGYWSYCVWGYEWTYKLSDNLFLNQDPDYTYLKINITARNNAKDSSILPQLKLIDNKGNEYDQTSKAFAVENGFNILESINPTLTKQGYIFFDVPSKKQYKLKLSGGNLSSEYAYVTID